MADFCSICEPEYFDINLMELEAGRSEYFICEWCNLRVLYKDESLALFAGRNIDDEIVLEPIYLEEL